MSDLQIKVGDRVIIVGGEYDGADGTVVWIGGYEYNCHVRFREPLYDKSEAQFPVSQVRKIEETPDE